MLREWTYTASSRDALGNTSPSALEISLGRGFCTPRPSRFPSGFALGKSLGPRGAKSPPLGNLSGLGGCISQYTPPLGSVRIQSKEKSLLILKYYCSRIHFCQLKRSKKLGVEIRKLRHSDIYLSVKIPFRYE